MALISFPAACKNCALLIPMISFQYFDSPVMLCSSFLCCLTPPVNQLATDLNMFWTLTTIWLTLIRALISVIICLKFSFDLKWTRTLSLKACFTLCFRLSSPFSFRSWKKVTTLSLIERAFSISDYVNLAIESEMFWIMALRPCWAWFWSWRGWLANVPVVIELDAL